MTMDSPRHDWPVRTATTAGLTLFFHDDAYKSATPPEWPRKSRSPETRAQTAENDEGYGRAPEIRQVERYTAAFRAVRTAGRDE
jgi:hypothetical protein